jgi:hypothetical protein
MKFQGQRMHAPILCLAMLATCLCAALLVAQGAPGATVTSVNEKSGVVTGKVNSTGQVFTFTLANKALLSHLHPGQGVFVNLGKKQVSLDGKSASGNIVSIAPLLRNPSAVSAGSSGSSTSSSSGSSSGNSGSSGSSQGTSGGTGTQSSGTIYTAAKMAGTPIPMGMVLGGADSCSQGYQGQNNSLLDVIVGGCTILGMGVVKPTQPDTADSTAPPAGAGPHYVLTVGNNRVVSGCRDKNGKTVDLQSCLKAAAYSDTTLNAALPNQLTRQWIMQELQ